MMQHEETKTDYGDAPPPSSGETQKTVSCNFGYLRTAPGILKVSEIVSRTEKA